MILEVSNLDISGNDFKEVHCLNIDFIFLTLEIFHQEILGKDIKEVHP